MAEHPQVNFASEKNRKELSFFNSNKTWQGEGENDLSTWDKGLDWYMDQYPPFEENKVRGELTVSYLIDSEAYKRIKEIFPDTKLFVILRNPADMLHSLYYWVKAGAIGEGPKETFEEEIKEDRFLDFARYHKHLKKFYENFPKEKIHVVIHDDIVKDSQKAL